MSHTVTVDVKMQNVAAVENIARKMGAEIMGMGNHRIFSSAHQGFAFKLPNWSYACIVDAAGNVYYDNYNGSWGDKNDIDKLKELYAVEVVKQECDNLGWYHEYNEATGELVINHPTGGTITLQKGGTLDASGFSGASCAEATMRLENAMGNRLGEALKPEMDRVQLSVGNQETEN